MKKNLFKLSFLAIVFTLVLSTGVVSAVGYQTEHFGTSYSIVPAPTMTYSNLTKIMPGETISVKAVNSSLTHTVRYWWDNNKATEKTGTNVKITAPYTIGTHVLNYEISNSLNSTGWKTCLYEVTNSANELRLNLCPTPGNIGIASGYATMIEVSLVGQNDYYYDNNNYYGYYQGNSITYSWNGGSENTIQASNGRIPYPSNPGVNVLNITYRLSSGEQVSKQYYYYSTEDTVAPKINSVRPSSGNVLPGETIKIYLSDDNGIADVNCFWESQGYTFTPKYTNASKTEAEIIVPNSGYGTQVLYIMAKDDSRFHNQTSWRAYTYNISNTGSSNQGSNQVGAPVVTFTPYSDNVEMDETIKVNITDNDRVYKYGYAWDNLLFIEKSTSSTNVNFSVKAPSKSGNHVLRVWAQDRYGNNTGTIIKNYYVSNGYNDYENSYDSGVPTITTNISNGANVSYNTNIDVTFSDNSGLASIAWAWDNELYQQQNVSGYTYTKSIMVPSITGAHTLRVNAKDRNGNYSGWKTYTIYVNTYNNSGNNNGYYGNDYEKPTISMTSKSVKSGSYVTPKFRDRESGLALIGWAWDDEAYQQEYVDGTTASYSHKIYVPTSNGKHTLYLNAKDRNGNITGWESYTITVTGGNSSYNSDKTAPTITFYSTSAKAGSYVTVKAKDTNSGLAVLGWAWNNENYQEVYANGTTSTFSYNIYVPETNGTHTLYLNAKDVSGNEKGWKTYTVKVTGGYGNGDFTAPTITFSSTSVKAGSYVTAKFKDTNSGLDLIGWAWDYEPYQQEYVNGTTSTYSYKIYVPDEKGKHTLYLNAKDRYGNKTGWKKYTVTVK